MGTPHRRSALKRAMLRTGVVALCLVGLQLVYVGPAFAGSPINGGGSGFAALEIDQWRADTARAPYNLNVNYVAQGSSFGRQQFSSGNFDYGASDIIFQPEEIANLQSQRCQNRALADCFVYVPVSAGGLAFMYNLVDATGHRLSNLQLTRAAACGIFTGAIKKWDDPAITATNPSLNGDDNDIIPVIRSDGAGESYVFSQFCIAVAGGVWNAFIQDRIQHDPGGLSTPFRNGQPVSNWPQGWGRSTTANGADNVANTVADPVAGQNSITYVAAGYAKVRSFPVASLENAVPGVFTQPDEANVTVALSYATGRGDGTFDLNFTAQDPRAYFPSTYSYILAQTTNGDVGKGATLAQFLCYAVGRGQDIAPALRYAALSTELVNIAVAAIQKIPGASTVGSCPVPGLHPPVTLPPHIGPGALGPGFGGAGGAGGGAGATATTAAGAGAAGANGGAGGTGTNCGTSSSSTTTSTKPATSSSTTTSTTKAGATSSTTSTTKPAASTTTTTIDCATSGSGGTGVADLQTQLAAAAGSHSSGDGGNTTTTLLIGFLIGGGISVVAALRRRVYG
jgi:phosphate transport system substrate-binding protein